MSYGIEFVPGNISVKEVVKYCKLAESTDIDFAWITNHYNNRHCYPTLAAIAQATESIKMGPGIMNTFTDTPAAIASFMCTLNEISWTSIYDKNFHCQTPLLQNISLSIVLTTFA